MGRAIKKLKALQVAALAKGTERRQYHGDGGGLWLQTTPNGASWIFRYKVNGRNRDMGLGSTITVSLADARERALECRKQRLDDIDPIEARKEKRQAAKLAAAKALTFKQCSDGYFKAHQAGWRGAKHAAQWSSSVAAYVHPIIGDLPVASIDVGLVMKVLEPIWTEKSETASRVRGRIESVLDWATARGLRRGENPARWRGHLENLLPKKSKVARVEHHPALAYDEIGEFVVDLSKREGVAARALEFAILTAARTGEIRGARWDEIDFNNRLWVIPAERMKANREHRVPLSSAALAILARMQEQRSGDYVFSARPGRPLNDRALLDVLDGMKRNDLTSHGFRSTFRDWAADRTNFDRDAIELALAHAVGDRVEQAYRRGDGLEKRRQLAEAWAAFCATPAPAVGGDNVRSIRGAAR
jgi:integrase